MSDYLVVIPCGGHGSRFASELPKQYHQLLGQTVLDWTLRVFEHCAYIDKIMVVASLNDYWIDGYAGKYSKLQIAKVGGHTRAESVLNGLNELHYAADDWILVHDAARCCLRAEDLLRLIELLREHPIGGILASKATDTIKQVNTNQQITATLDRNFIYQAQTPQMFKAQLLHQALSAAGDSVTDEASAVEQLDYLPQIIDCGSHNFKITFPHDLKLAAIYLQEQIERANNV